MKPLVSIIIPTYNRAHLIEETLDSIIAQTHTNWECIVVDDGSIDNTTAILANYCKKDSRFQFYNRPSNKMKGASACRNLGIEISRGEFVQFLDSDDILANNKLDEQLKKIHNKAFSIVICKWGIFNHDINDTLFKKDLAYYKDFNSSIDLFNILGKYGLYIPIHAFLISKKLIDKSGTWNEKLTINDDGEFFSRILMNAKSIYYTENTCVYYRKNNDESLSSYTNIKKLKNLVFSWKLIESNLKPLFISEKNLYVINSKKRIFSQLKQKHKLFILNNCFYFKLSIYNYILNYLKL